MGDYKIIKKYDSLFGKERYFVYRKYFGLIWIKMTGRSMLEDAENYIKIDKEERQNKKKPDEFIGYY